MWFEDLTGFQEASPEQVRANLTLRDQSITSRINGASATCGRLETPTLAELRAAISECDIPRGRISVRESISDAKSLHAEPGNAGALFQVASQFNLLEMPSEKVGPERGVGVYEYDRTQGPACAIAAGAGTIFRSYFAPVNGRIGQTADNQIDCLKNMGKVLGNTGERLWAMKNGYAMASEAGLIEISEKIRKCSAGEYDVLRQNLQIGVQWDTQVTLPGCEHLVSQAYCSALPVAYSPQPAHLWTAFARLILEASYEATLCAAVLNLYKTASNKVYLTLIGGGVFGNHDEWIFSAIARAIKLFSHVPLDIAIVSHGASKPRVQRLISQLQFSAE